MTRVAAIDCGTNTIRLLIADARASSGGAVRLVPLVRLNEIVRLGQGVDRTGRLDEAALERTLAVVGDYADRCRELGAQSVRFVATSATRDASNRAVFVEGVRELLDVEPEVVSGQEEARLSFAGSLLGADGGGAFPSAAAGPAGSEAAATAEPDADPVDPAGARLRVRLARRRPRRREPRRPSRGASLPAGVQHAAARPRPDPDDSPHQRGPLLRRRLGARVRARAGCAARHRRGRREGGDRPARLPALSR